jgi:hypothetical protein
MVIEAVGDPGGFASGLPDDAPLTPPFVAQARAGGVTAVTVTVKEIGNAPGRFETRANDLARRGWRTARIEKILGRNFARLFTEVWA